MILLDEMNALFISFSMARKAVLQEQGRDFLEKDVPFFYHIVFNKLNRIFSVYGKTVVCQEGIRSLEWRRSIYPDYKRNRDASKANNDYKVFKGALSEINEVLTYFPTKMIASDEAEADDVIFALCEKYHERGNITIISSDGDLSQIASLYENVRHYNPIKGSFFEPHKYLVESKAIVGDASDNIPGIPRIGKKTFEKMMEDKKLFNEKMRDGNREIYEKFLEIVDLKRFPTPFKAKVLDIESKTIYNKFDPENIELFFFDHGLKEQLQNWGRVRDEIYLRLESNGKDINE